jgi:hypothetical protein
LTKAEVVMNARSEKMLQAFDQRRCTLLDQVEALSAERLVARPIPGTWSILEIVEHLVLAEREVLQNLAEPSELVARRRGLKAHLAYPMVMVVLKCGIPVKAPSPRMLPKGNTSLADLRRQWDESQRWFRSYVNALDREGFGRAVFAHPVAGPMNVGQTLHMGQLHVATHSRQIRRLIELTN